MAIDPFWGSVIGAGGSLLSGWLGADAAKDAGKESSSAALAAQQQQLKYARENRDLGLALAWPQYQGGLQAYAGLMDMVGLDRGQATGLDLGGGEGGQGQGEGLTDQRVYPGVSSLWKGTQAEWRDFVDMYYDDPTVRADIAAGKPIGAMGGKKFGDLMNYTGDMPEGRNSFLTSLDRAAQGQEWNNGAFQWDESSGQLIPVTGGGAIGLPEIMAEGDLSRFDEYSYQQDPGYQFRLDEGMRALENSAAARGGLVSGGFGRDAMTYGQNMASQEYMNTYNRLANLAGMGQVAAGMGQGAIGGSNAGLANAAGYGYAAGTNRAAGIMGEANAWGGAINDIGYGLGYSMMNQGPSAISGGGGQEFSGINNWGSFQVPGMG